MTAPEEDRTAEYLSGNRYPLGRSIRDHIGAYVNGIPQMLATNNEIVEEAYDRAKDMADDDPVAVKMLEDALRLNHASQAMAAVHSDLTDLLAFIDWEHSFHEVGASDMTPGHRALLFHLVKRATGEHGILCKILNGGQVSAEITIGRGEALQTAHALTEGVKAIDRADQT